jgi:elongation factor Ts
VLSAVTPQKCSNSTGRRPNNSFKPNLLRSSESVAEKACHAFASTTQVGLIQVLGPMDNSHRFIDSYVHNGRIGVLVELTVSSADLVRTPAFVELAKQLAMHIAVMGPASPEELLQHPFVFDTNSTVSEAINRMAETSGRIEVLRFVRWVASDSPTDDSPRSPALIFSIGRARAA